MEGDRVRLLEIASSRRTKSAESQAAWKEAEVICHKWQIKHCTGCQQLLAFDQFYKSCKDFLGLKNNCIECKKQGPVPGVKRKYGETSSNVTSRIIEAYECGQSTSRYEVEALGSDMLKRQKIVDVRFWQDGTLSDAGIRPTGSKDDKWLPVQLKSTAKVEPPYIFNNCEKYGSMAIVGTTGNSTCFMFSSESAMANGQVKIGRSVQPLTIDGMATKLLEMYSKVSGLNTEAELRSQCSPSSKIELNLMLLSSSIVDGHEILWPSTRNSVVDRLLKDGTTIQDKAAGCNTDVKMRFFHGSLKKKFRKTPVPYLNTDCKMFVFSTLYEKRRLFIEWRIPSEWLEKEEYLTVFEDGKLACPGRVTTIALGLPDELQIEIFGEKTTSNVASKTVQFVNVYPLPDGYCVPECLKGRDP